MTHNPDNPSRRSGEPRLASFASWAVLTASFGLSASTWIALAALAGFTSQVTVFGVTARLAWLMPISVDGYVIVALVLWMSPVPTVVTAFAKKNTYMAASIGIVAQSAYHALLTWSTTETMWRTVLAALVGSLPPAVAGLAVHMRALIRRHGNAIPAAGTPTTPVVATVPDPQPMPAAVPNPIPTPIVAPAPVPPVPTPAQLADRITAPSAGFQLRPAPVPGLVTRPRRTRPSTPTTSPAQPVPPAKDSSVAEPAVPVMADPISPALLARATDVARQYRTTHGTPITAGQLAVRLTVSSAEATQLLARMKPGPNTTPPITTVNGHRIEAAR
jgi:hypothetical protein